MLSIGLTGGIGSGKSQVAQYFSELGVPVVDADVIAHELVEPGSDALAEITAVFGDDILDDKGTLDRNKLAGIVFNDAQSKHKLESILHPRVREQIEAYKVRYKDHPYILIVIPLLLESEQPFEVDRVLVVEAPEHIRIQRVQQRDGRSTEQIRNIIDSQVNDKQRRSAADDVIVNDNSLEKLKQSVEKLNAKYTSLTG
jgi:dephospho-CoA kinase